MGEHVTAMPDRTYRWARPHRSYEDMSAHEVSIAIEALKHSAVRHADGSLSLSMLTVIASGIPVSVLMELGWKHSGQDDRMVRHG